MNVLHSHLVRWCATCSALQRSAVAFGETLPVPEIVVIGGQVTPGPQARHNTCQHAGACNFASSVHTDLIIVFSQSDGKSSLLEAFLGVSSANAD